MGIQLGLILLLVVAALLVAKKFQKKDLSDAVAKYGPDAVKPKLFELIKNAI